MDAGGLNGRGIGEVDVGHDDRTTIKIWFAFLLYNLLYYKPLYLLYIHYTLPYAFKVNIFMKLFFIGNEFNRNEDLNRHNFYPPS